MLNKKNITIAFVIAILCIGIITFFYLHRNIQEVVEILPEEEISDEQYRKTMVSLYYKNKNTQKLMPEVQLIDVKLLINEPYTTLLELLMNEPRNENLECVIPKGTKINKVELKSDILWVDLSNEFIENHPGGMDEELNTIYSIVNTLTELTEVNGVRILIENQENKAFKDNNLNFNETFLKIEDINIDD